MKAKAYAIIKQRPNGTYCYRMKVGKEDKTSSCWGSYRTKAEARKAASKHLHNIRLDLAKLRRRWDREIAAAHGKKRKR